MGLELVLDEGGGAFYGPKISVQARDAIGRTWQMSTIQLDFQTPQRFGLEYVGADNARHRPIMIHRALFGSVERFFAILLEHYAGALPTWLMPEQVRVLPVRDDDHGTTPRARGRPARGRRLRVEVDAADEPLGARIRRAKLREDPLRPRGRRRRRGRGDGRGEPPGERHQPERGVALDRLRRRGRSRRPSDRPAGPQPPAADPRVSPLEQPVGGVAAATT